MTKRKVIVELKYNKDLADMAFAAAPAAERELDAAAAPAIAGVKFDTSFAPVNLPGMSARTAMDVPYASGEKFNFSFEPQQSTYIVRAEVEESKISDLTDHKSVVNVFADVEIQPSIICPGSPPLGTDADVARLLNVASLHKAGMDGSGVMIAIVDTGFNLAYLAAHGKTITLDAARSWVPSAGMTPGDAPVSHGTMCAFDAAIAAPKATFLDIQVLRSTKSGSSVMEGLLSDAVAAYTHLCNTMNAPKLPGENRSLVVSNSWGMFHPTWDFPVGDPGNYSDNPNHPFNRIVSALEGMGADILFAAGNCGADCPDRRCEGATQNAIYGANGHNAVLTIAGVDTSKTRVGYSTQGPGRLSRDKPDLCGYTHFKGSGVYAADGGTSAATPVVAGMVAVVRTKRPYAPGNPVTSPASIRALMRSTAQDLGATGFDFDHGYGVVNGSAIYRKFFPIVIDICKKYPWLCKRIPRAVAEPSGVTVDVLRDIASNSIEDSDIEDVLLAIYQAGYTDGQHATVEEDVQSTNAGD